MTAALRAEARGTAVALLFGPVRPRVRVFEAVFEAFVAGFAVGLGLVVDRVVGADFAAVL